MHVNVICIVLCKNSKFLGNIESCKFKNTLKCSLDNRGAINLSQNTLIQHNKIK